VSAAGTDVMGGAVAIVALVVVVLPVLSLAAAAVITAALGMALAREPGLSGQMLQRDWPKR